MLILGIETATEQVSVAIGGHEGVLGLFEVCRGRRHAETLTPAIAFTCQQARIELCEVSVVAVDLGPGLFTGLRVGLAFAQGLGAALGLPVVGLPTLDALAASLPPGPGRVAAVIDARRGQVYARLFDGGAPVDEAQALAVEAFGRRLDGIDDGGRLVGTGAGLFTATGWEAHPLDGPTPEALIRLTRAGRIVNGVGADPDIIAASAKAYLNALNKLYTTGERLNPQTSVTP